MIIDMKSETSGFSKTKIIIIVAIIIIIFGLGQILIAYEKARSRDIERVGDALLIHMAFERLYQHDRSYAAAAENNGCETIGQLVTQCRLHDYYQDINKIVDPGKYSYQITQVPTETSYEVSFWLEIGHKDLTKGRHTIIPEGIR